jgi:hypothetical protein
MLTTGDVFVELSWMGVVRLVDYHARIPILNAVDVDH